MTEWQEVALGDLLDDGQAEIRTGPFGTQLRASDYTTDGVPVINVRNLGYGTIRTAEIERVDESVQLRLANHLLSPGDIVFGRKGAVDRHVLVSENESGWMQGSDCIRVRVGNDSPVSAEFLSKALLTPSHKNWMEAQCSHGATMASLNQEILRRIRVSIPDRLTQRRITAALSAFDELIEINERRIELLEDLARSLYREWFVRFRFPGHENVDLVDSELGPIPNGWLLQPIADLASKERYAVSSGPFGSKLGRKDYVDSGVPVIRGTNLALGGGFRDDGFVFVAPHKADELVSSLAHPGDIIVTQRGTLGQIGLLPFNARFERYVISQSQMKITVDPVATSSQYLYFVLRSSEATRRILNMAISTGVPHINLAMLREMPVICPPTLLQFQFEQLVAPMIQAIEEHQRSIAALAATRDLLLPRLVTGRLDVSDIDLGDLLPAEAA